MQYPPFFFFFLFDCACDTFRKALLEEEENDNGRNRTDQYAEHQHTIINHISAQQVGNQHRHGNGAVGLQNNLRPHIVVPCVHESDDQSCCVCRFHSRNEHTEKDSNLTQTIQPGRFYDIMWERPGCLTEHHDHEWCRDGRKHESRHRVDHLQLGKHPEQRDHDRCKRNHHSCQQNSKYDIFCLCHDRFQNRNRPGSRPADRSESARSHSGRNSRVHGKDPDSRSVSYNSLQDKYPESVFLWIHPRSCL